MPTKNPKVKEPEIKVVSQASAMAAKPTDNQSGAKNGTDPSIDVFKRDWQAAESHWLKRHRVYDFAYLNYRSILTLNAFFGKSYLDVFGHQAFVPLTFQTIAAIKSPMNNRKIEFVVKSRSRKNEKREKYVQRMDNIEWQRSNAEVQLAEATHYALLLGEGYLLNEYVCEKVLRHFVKTEVEKPDLSEGEPAGDDYDEEDDDGVDKLEWEEKTITKYEGMRPRSVSPWHVFTRPGSTCDADRGHVYIYVPTEVNALREFVIGKGWMTKEKAEQVIIARPFKRFDSVRDTIDAIFDEPITPFTRGDHQTSDARASATSVGNAAKSAPDTCGVIMRFEEDYFEMRVDGLDETIYKDFNAYPHKEIPIITIFDDKIPGEFAGIGEAEKIRWQQIEENRVHNYALNMTLLSIVQRYAINTAYLEDETEANFNNPFRPIRLKKGMPGVRVDQAIQALPMPDLKRSPLEMSKIIQETAQKTTGASDFLTSASNSKADTATESNNLVAATTSRIREKAREIDQDALPRLIKQWHPCYPAMYDSLLEFRLTGDKSFSILIPGDRADMNNDHEEIKKAADELDVMLPEGWKSGEGTNESPYKIADGADGKPKVTLSDVYRLAGYDLVMFSDDFTGEYDVETKVTDIELDANQTINSYLKALKVMADLNTMLANSGDPRRLDVYKLATEALRQFPQIRNVEDYEMKGNESPMIPQTGQAPVEGDPAAPGGAAPGVKPRPLPFPKAAASAAPGATEGRKAGLGKVPTGPSVASA